MPPRWDNIEILRAIDELQELAEGGPAWHGGVQLMEQVAGGFVHDEQQTRGFVQELHIAAQLGLLTFRISTAPSIAAPNPDSQPRYYLESLRDFALTPTGQDRARGRVVVQEPPDPAEDDGRAISNLILAKVGAAIEDEYNRSQAETLLSEAGLPLNQIGVDSTGLSWVHAVLSALDAWGSEGRRHLRRFLGEWLDDRLIIGPSNELRAELVEKFARQGWYVVDGKLVIGEPSRGSRVSSPILRDARLAVLHPQVLEVAEGYVLSEHFGAAVFEATKSLTNRVKTMTGRAKDGTALMQRVFSAEDPDLLLGDLTTLTGRNMQEGFRFIFTGAVQAIRNPPAHELFEDMALNEALEYLAFISLLMRKLDDAQPAPASAFEGTARA